MYAISWGTTLILGIVGGAAFMAIIGVYILILVSTLMYRATVNITSEDDDTHLNEELDEGKIENVHTTRPLWLNAIAAGLAILGIGLVSLMIASLFA